MRISSVQASQSFDGKLYLTDKAKRITHVYKTTPITDASLLESFQKVHNPSKKMPRFSDLGAYLKQITEILPKNHDFGLDIDVVVAAKLNITDFWGKAFSYTTYKEGSILTELETDELKITHDMRK